MKRRINRRNGVGILMAAVVAAGSLQVPALAQVEAAESVPVVETTTLEDGNLGAASSQGAQLNFSNIGATYNVKTMVQVLLWMITILHFRQHWMRQISIRKNIRVHSVRS